MQSTATLTADRTTVPGRYRGLTFAAYQPATETQRQALGTMRDLSSGVLRSAVLIGPPGVGKSHLAAAACAEYADRERELRSAADAAFTEAYAAWQRHGALWNERPTNPIHHATIPQWVNVPSLVVDLRAEMNLPPSDQDQTRFARSLRTDDNLVVLDDLGRERMSEWTGELVYVIVNDRYEAGLPTIATSNLSAEELVASGYWPAISRLVEDGRLVEISAPDHRLSHVTEGS